jgi:uncharacterized protein
MINNTILLYPLLKCPVGCAYCFQNKNIPSNEYNREVMISKLRLILKENIEKKLFIPNLVLHGGEVLSLPIEDFEFFIKSIFDINGSPSLQTSLSILSQEHIRIFKQYKVNLGISIDGPAELNRLRGPRDEQKNKIYQSNLIENINWLRQEKISFGAISVLTKINAAPDKIDRLIEWGTMNSPTGRYNPMFVPNENDELKQYELAPLELKHAFLKLAQAHFQNPKGFIPTVVSEVKGLLLGEGNQCCCFSRCDYLTTQCTTIMGDGNLSRCDRCFESGYNYAPLELTHSYSRSDILKQTECFGCRYWEICGGQCPSEGTGGDPRRKSKFCEAWYALYEIVEKQIRSVYPNTTLTIDIPNYFNEYSAKGRSLRPLQNNRQLQQQKQQSQEEHGDWSNFSKDSEPSNGGKVSYHPNIHGDNAHAGGQEGCRTKVIPHGDNAHADGHGDWSDHKDVPHGDSCERRR